MAVLIYLLVKFEKGLGTIIIRNNAKSDCQGDETGSRDDVYNEIEHNMNITYALSALGVKGVTQLALTGAGAGGIMKYTGKIGQVCAVGGLVMGFKWSNGTWGDNALDWINGQFNE